MKLSIVIPAFNEEAYIGKCLESIIKAISHTSHSVEIIVVDNASTDQTAAIASDYPKVKVFYESHQGTNYARQLGLIHSTGELIANIDADSILPIHWLNYAIKVFNKDDKLVALSGPYVFYDLSRLWRILAKFYFWLAYPVYVINNRLFNKGGALMGGNVVIRKSALEQVGGYNTAITFYGDDTDTAQRLNKFGKVKFDYNFEILSSGRRFKNDGGIYTTWRYIINHFWISIFDRPYHKDI